MPDKGHESERTIWIVDASAQQGDATTITKARHSTSTRMSRIQESIQTNSILMSVHALHAKVVHLHLLYPVVLTIQHICREHRRHDENSRGRGVSRSLLSLLSLLSHPKPHSPLRLRNLHDAKERIVAHYEMREAKEVSSAFAASNVHAKTILTTKITAIMKKRHAAFVPRVHQ